MPVITTQTSMDGEDEILLLPDDMTFGIGVELILERSGDVLTMRPTTSSITQGAAEEVGTV